MYTVILFFSLLAVFLLYIRYSTVERNELKEQNKVLTAQLERFVQEEDKVIYQLLEAESAQAANIKTGRHTSVH